MNQNLERCKTKTKNEARKGVCITRIEEVDDVEHEKTNERRKQEEEEEFGEWKTTRRHDPRQPSEQERIEHEMTHLPFRIWCRHCIKGKWREGDCRDATQEERQVPEIRLVSRSWATKRKGKRRRFLVAETERRELCSARRSRGSRRESGNVEGCLHGFVKSGWSLWT